MGSSAKKNKTGQNNNDLKSIKILKTASLCFAIISFIATAEGLKEYVFNYEWQAYAVSFAIQSILFVFNLNLPKYFSMLKNKFTNEKTIKVIKGVMALFYIAVLLSSSWYSYVFISGVSYESTKYDDANIVLERSYRDILVDTDKYITETLKASKIIISEKLSELIELTSSDENSKMISSLEQEYSELNNDLNNMQEEIQLKKEIYEAAKDKYSEPLSVRWRNSKERDTEKSDYKDAKKEYDDALKEKSNLQKKINNLSAQIHSASSNTIAPSILAEILKTNPDDEKLEKYIEQFNQSVINIKDKGEISENYSQMVKITEELNVCINNYLTLSKLSENASNADDSEVQKDASNDKKTIISVKDLEDEFMLKKSTITVAKSNEEKMKYWQSYFDELETLIESIPSISENEIKSLDEDVINVDILRDYDSKKTCEKIDTLIRTNVININGLEYAFRLLFCKYPFMAWFSLFFAIFLDVASMSCGVLVFSLTKKQFNT